MFKIKELKKGIMLMLVVWMFSFQISAQVLSLDSILHNIDRNQPELKMYDAKIKAYETYATGAKSLEPPQVGAGFFMTPYNPQYWKADGMSNGMGSFMLSAQQMFTNPKRLNANANYMQSMSNVEKQMKNKTRNEIFGMAKMSYYEWIILKKKLSIIGESEALLNYIIQSTELRYTYGMDKLNSYYKAKAMLGDIQNMKLMVELEIKQQRININTIMNLDKNYEFDIDTVFTFKNYEGSITDTAFISSNRSDYKAFEQNVNLLKSKQLYEQSKASPDIGIRYDHMLAFGNQPQQFSLMAMVTIPIASWSSKMYKSNVSGLNYEIESIKNQQQALINQTAGNLQNIQVQMKSKKQQIELYEKTIIPSIRKNYQTTLLAYEQNTEELFMVLDAIQNLKLAQIGYYDQLKDLLLLQVEYEKQLEIR